MSVVVSLLRAIDRADGEALVMHVGEKPYVVTATGHAELAANALTVPAMTGMLEQLLPADSRQALEELGAVEYHLPAESASPGTRYSVVAARGGDDIWIEVRRRKHVEEPPPALPDRRAPETAAAVDGRSPVQEAPPTAAARTELAVLHEPEAAVLHEPSPAAFDEPEPPAFERWELVQAVDSVPDIVAPDVETPGILARDTGASEIVDRESEIVAEEIVRQEIVAEEIVAEEIVAREIVAREIVAREIVAREIVAREIVAREVDPPRSDGPALDAPEPPSPAMFGEPAAGDAATVPPKPAPGGPDAHEEHRYVVRDVADRFELRLQTEDDFVGGTAADDDDLDADAPGVDDRAPAFDFTRDPGLAPEPCPAPARDAVPPQRVSVPLEGTPWLASIPAHHADPAPRPAMTAPQAALHRLLKIAAVQGASALYVAPQARPSLRVDGEMRVLDEPPMTAGELEADLRSLVVGGVADGALPLGEFETRELHGVGRVQCLLFRDHRGLGAIFRMLPGRAVSAQKAGLSAGIQSLCTEPEGLLLVAGPQGAGKSTLVAALVDQINRTRRDHVISVESDIQFEHENHTSFISQREARDEPAFLEAVRAAIREVPDVLVIDGVMNAEVASTLLEAASAGLVVASLAAPSTAAALERFIGLVGGDGEEARARVSEHLRGLVTQALLRKTGGGRVAAREVLVNVPAVAALVAHAQLDQLPGVLTGGRRLGMVPLNDALLELVQSGALDMRQAYRKSPDPGELVGMLTKAGFDTAFAEHLG